MKVPKAAWLPLLVGGIAVLLLPVLLRRPAPPAMPPQPPPPQAEPVTASPVAELPPAPPPPLSAQSDPLLRQWQVAIRQHDAKGVLAAQSAFLAREGEYRDLLLGMAKEEADPRIRAFSVAVLGRMKAPPAEEVFIGRLGDLHEHPRTSALQALEQIGTAACLPAVDRLAASDPVEGVRAAAERSAKAVRSR